MSLDTATIRRVAALARLRLEEQDVARVQGELTGTEDRIAFARQTYNDAVTKLNTGIQTFPAVLIAGMLGFKEEPFFETPQAEKDAPKVQF